MDHAPRAGGVATLTGEPASPEDRRWLVERADQPGLRVLLRLDEDRDVAGHMTAEDPTLVRLLIQDDELDAVGHAISIRLPSVEAADAFRRRLLLTGVLVGTVVLGSAGAALAIGQGVNSTLPSQEASQIDLSDATPLPGPAPTPADRSFEEMSYEDATPNDATV